MAGEGKSTVSCNLATGLAQRGYRVLLVDADMRCASTNQQLGTGFSLSTILTDDVDISRHYQPFPDLTNLTILPAGSRQVNPTDILGSSRMLDLMAGWRKEYDYIIVDTPPVLPFSDALVVATLADGLILVARSGISQKKALLRAKTILGRSGANILGFVLNAVKHGGYAYDYPAGYTSFVNNKAQ
jgi:capsular exopolysaccharide synthesis family protein